MLTQLVLTNIFFAVSVFVSLVFFSTGWLHLDSWKLDKKVVYLLRSIGFFLLSISTLITSVRVSNDLLNYFIAVFEIFGCTAIALSLIASPITKKPQEKAPILFFLPTLPVLNNYLMFVPPIALILITILYIYRVTKGLEKQLSGITISFIFFSLASILKTSFFWQNSSVVTISNLLTKFGPIDISILVLEFIGAVILAGWAWGYIRFRAQVQIFITTLCLVLSIFLITTFSFTFLLLRNIEANILDSLTSNAKVVLYSLERLQFESLANAKAVAQNQEVVNNFSKNLKEELFVNINSYMLNQNLSFLDVVSASGKVYAAAEDKDLKNISLSEDPIIVSAINGNYLATLNKKSGPIAPTIEAKASSPIRIGTANKITGAVVAGFIVDNAFLDNLKESTGMEITLYADDVRSASTLISSNGETRLVGIKETDATVTDKVLKKGETWSGRANIINKPYYLVFLPIKSYNEEIIGMVSVGQPQSTLGKTAQKSIDTTLMVSAILIVLSVLPAYFISKYIEDNITA